ncbi:hypothetical protein [Nonomuraea sp. NPDC049309]|uniref:hypothetical protein n=1 Tax=Nonomuraea sp. NPDC049309 TaxID=3364350 RepID=UPI003721FD43
MRRLVITAVAVGLAVTGCAKVEKDWANQTPPNDGANANIGQNLQLRNAFLLGSADPASPAPEQALYVVLVNSSDRPATLENITVEGGGTVQLAGPVAIPPDHAIGTGNQPIGTVSGARGTSVPMTFTFQDRTSVRVFVPVMARAGQYANLPLSPAAPPTASPPATAPPTAPTTDNSISGSPSPTG